MILASHGLIASQIQSFVGLLDLYPSAAAAYSVRKLRATYSGSAIRVRRSSDNTEQDIGFANNVLDTSALTTFCSGTNGFVTTWYDQSGNSRNATQTTAANQPQIVSSGSVLLYSGKPTLKFDGSNDYLLTPNFSYGSALSLYYVTQRNGSATGDGYAPEISMRSTISLATDVGAFHYIGPTLKGASFPFFPNFGSYDLTGNYANADKYLINYEQTNSVGFDVYRNNSREGGTTTSGSIPSTTQGFIIAMQTLARFTNNNFSEVIMWNTNQASNRSTINTNINAYYGIY
jgi:hypothetical protein